MAHVLSLSPYDIQLYAANGKTINTIGIAKNVTFQVGGHTITTNLVVIADHLGADDFLLGRNFLCTYNGPDSHEGHHSRPQVTPPF